MSFSAFRERHCCPRPSDRLNIEDKTFRGNEILLRFELIFVAFRSPIPEWNSNLWLTAIKDCRLSFVPTITAEFPYEVRPSVRPLVYLPVGRLHSSLRS